MKKTLAAAMLGAVLTSQAGAADQTLEETARALKLFSVLEVERKGAAIRTLMDHPKITDVMYHAMAKAVCGVQWDRPSAFDGVEAVHITNRFSAQGYVIEDPEATCATLGQLKSDDGRAYLPGKTHLHFRNDF